MISKRCLFLSSFCLRYTLSVSIVFIFVMFLVLCAVFYSEYFQSYIYAFRLTTSKIMKTNVCVTYLSDRIYSAEKPRWFFYRCGIVLTFFLFNLPGFFHIHTKHTFNEGHQTHSLAMDQFQTKNQLKMKICEKLQTS